MRPARNQTPLFLLLLVSPCVLASNSFAQQPRPTPLPAPPPMHFVSRDDRSQLSGKDSKARIRLTIDLAANHLTRMEELTNEKKFDQASEILGNYLGLIDDVKLFLSGLVKDKNGTRDLYRHLDIALRAHIPRLAVLRRGTPSDYAVHIKEAEEFIRNTRSEALESFYGHTVLKTESTEKNANATKSPSEETKRP